MASIRKTVLTPVKWASRKVLHHTLLTFPGGDPHDPIACTYCPEMCRFACPSAVVSASDAVTPCNKMSLLHKEERWPGRAAAGGELWPLYDCTGCGRCTEHCVHGVTVADQLFEARAQHSWSPGREILLSDIDDPYGDIAEEIGDEASASRRFERIRAKTRDVFECDEARVVYFLGKRGVSAALAWQWVFLLEERHAFWDFVRTRLAGRTWLLYESSWLNRRLGRSAQTDLLHARLSGASALRVLRAFAHGKDCIDCGGETPGYIRLFPHQARQMAREWWERDAHRAQGVLSLSPRAARHLSSTLPGLELVDFAALCTEFQKSRQKGDL